VFYFLHFLLCPGLQVRALDFGFPSCFIRLIHHNLASLCAAAGNAERHNFTLFLLISVTVTRYTPVPYILRYIDQGCQKEQILGLRHPATPFYDERIFYAPPLH
jgi:hypothetical protein